MATSKKDLTHIKSRKLDAKLRMYANGSREVNEIRSEFQSNLALTTIPKDLPQREWNPAAIPKLTSKLKKRKQIKNLPTNIVTDVFIEVSPDSNVRIKEEIVRRGNLISAQLPLTRLGTVANPANKDYEKIVNIEISRSLRFSEPVVTNKYASKKKIDGLFNTHFTKKNAVIIGIIDVGGFDFSHPEFLDKQGKTRFLRIWDQGGDFREAPKRFGYGSELKQDDLNRALTASKSLGIPPYHIEKQSQLTVGSHGTHVASIAAGNSGVCADAEIVGVLISLKEADFDRRKSFYDSAAVIHAIEYLVDIANEAGKPLAINISLGTNGHAHDGSDAASRWIDSVLTEAGRCITIAAGNAGQDAPEDANDLGFVMGRIHTSGKIKSSGLENSIEWHVVGNGISDISENELELWYSPQDRFSIKIKPPGGDWIGPVGPNEYIENMQLRSGSFISIYNELYYPSNGLNYIAVYLSPNFNPTEIIPIEAGVWEVRIIGDEVRDGSYHAWIERDDPRPLGPIGGDRNGWNFPSFFSETSNVDNTSISSMACSRFALSVGNLHESKEKVNVSSSQGPTRDGRSKPEVIAPGTDIVAAKGFSSPDDLWIGMTGTSMAAPFVCGVAAQMLQVESRLTAPQITGIIVRTSTPLPGQDYAWKDDAGFGKINPQKCIDEAKNIFNKKDLNP